MVLNQLRNFEFSTQVEEKVITIQLKFTCTIRNRTVEIGHNFVREASNPMIKDSQVVCT